MQEIKYQPLKNNDDDTIVEYHDNDNDQLIYNKKPSLQEYKIYWLLKLLFLCFIIVKSFYVLNNYNEIMQWLIQSKETDINKTLYNNVTTDSSFKDIFVISNKKEAETNTTNAVYTTSTPTIISNYYDGTTQILYTAGRHGEMVEENSIDINYYGNADLTTLKIKDDTKVTTKTIINLINNKTAKETTIRTTLTTALYLNEKITSTLPTIINITDLPKENLTAATATTIVTTASTTKSPVAKYQQKYFINTSHCHIPFVDPFTSEIRNIFKPRYKTGCTTDQAIISTSFNEFSNQYILHINYTLAEFFRRAKNPPIEEDVLCCYKEIIRSGSGANVDNSFKLLPCTNFHQNFSVPLHINGIIVNCKSKSKKLTLQEDAFSFIQLNKSSIQRGHFQNDTIKIRKPSVLMIGIDTLSRINFRRNMPKTYKYLVKNKWYELMGYNKVGDNTLPNLMPLLSGYTRTTVYKKCNPKMVGGFDDCNFIWTTFKRKGYYTAYAEDTTAITTFNYHLKGFQRPPTDYYFHPFALAIEKSLKRKTKAGLNYCLGRRQFGEYVYDYGTEFATRYKNQSSFGFFWTNSFSHNSYDISSTMDSTMVKYFEKWAKRGILENSVIIFFSDHGARWGPLLKLSEGFLEERLPMFFISIPKWFGQKYKKLVKNLEINQHRLVSPFDIHMTLQHLLKLGEPTYNIQQTYDCPKCQSIFEEMPENRTCNDAGIPETWCTCIPYKTESTNNSQVKAVTQLIIKEMNRYLELKNLTTSCSLLKLKEITMAKKRYVDELKLLNNLTTYAIDFITDPLTKPKTLFSATVDYDEHNGRIQLNVEDISRQSLYENTAKCIDDKQYKKYCICKNSLKPLK